MKDAWGEEIEVGDIVVYPSRTGSAMWMVRAVVTAVVPLERYYIGQEEQTVKVRRLCEARWGKTHPAEDQEKEFTIQAPERLTRIGRRF